MLNLNKKLIQLYESGKEIKVGLVGTGQMGKGLISQIERMKGMRVVIAAATKTANVINAYKISNISEADITCVSNEIDANEAIQKGKYVACEDFNIINKSMVDVVVDATGSTDAGAEIALGAIRNHKHIIMLNVETDVTVGHILKQRADEAGVIYSASSGDEPGSVKELYNFAEALGFEILVMGKGKNNKVDLSSNPDSVLREATERGIAPKMLASFKDGTKTMVEMTCMSNSTGFLPDIRGAHGPKATQSNVCEILDLKENGGILNSYKTVEYVDGMAPGVFIIITSDLPQIHHEIQYLKIGKGPNYCLFRPYHLCSLETPLTIAQAFIYNEACLVPAQQIPFSETITIAKKDLQVGEKIDGIGGYCVYGSFEQYAKAKAERLVPIGLINKNTTVRQPLKKGQAITYDDLIFDENSAVYKLRAEQEEFIRLVQSK